MLVIVVVGAIIGMYLPWYAMGISAAIIAYVLGMKIKGSFVIGFAAGFIFMGLGSLLYGIRTSEYPPKSDGIVATIEGPSFSFICGDRNHRRFNYWIVGLGWRSFKTEIIKF